MIQFNLLPDVKLEYIKAQRTKRTVIGISLIAAASSFGIFLILFLSVNVVQKKAISDLSGDIKKYNNQIKNTPDLAKIVTIQSQLGVLPALHQGKVEAGRTFSFVQQFTPADVTISELNTDFETSTIEITGDAPSLDKVNTFVDTLKFTTFKTEGGVTDKAFSNVVLTQFSRDSALTTYMISFIFNPALYDNTVDVTLAIPSTVTTRSVIEQPTDIFKQNQSTTNKNTGN